MNLPRNPHAAAGFSLVEMAVVLVIFALLAGGMMVSLSTQQEIQRLSEARRQLSDIREALIGYAVANGRLPPPANPAIASGTAGAGEMVEGLTMGVLPWATLGLPETDPWGQRFTYRLRSEFADAIANATVPSCAPDTTPPAPTQASFALCSKGNITITDGAANIATNLPAIVISHGRNGLGGYRSTGVQAAGALGDEAENADNDANFVARTQTQDFDDEAIWIPLPILMSRMIAAGRLP
ncbi:MAG: prepilin-type cleavage/methylation domain-containing protein [Betaproteobacteria bacterium HGW-Betaproteobacteria-12]|nr:MAG: prepilin-type cleavage/methylation domain-containing protein [Betaproteobacteria bacterium HGW-Betaproteobacteria-12]